MTSSLMVLGPERYTIEDLAATTSLFRPASQHATLPEAGPQSPHAQGGGQNDGECLS